MTTAAAPVGPAARLRTWGSFVRFEHTLFSLPLILAGVFSAPGPAMSAARWLLIAVAAVGARTAAMSLNRIVDRRLDALNPRTKVRELPSGRMSLGEGLALLALSTAVYLTACWALDPATFFFLKMAPIPLVVFAGYPYLKRFTPFCHLGVGLGLALAPLAGWAAAHPDLAEPAGAVGLALFALCWVTGFDIIYATLDEDFDRAHGVRSMVVWLGRTQALGVSRVLHVAAWAALFTAAMALIHAGAVRATAWGLATGVLLGFTAVLLYFEQRWAEDVNLAFFKVNIVVGAAVLLTVLSARLAGGGF